MDSQADAVEEIVMNHALPGKIEWVLNLHTDALEERQDRMPAGYFLCPRPLPICSPDKPEPDWLLGGCEAGNVIERNGWKRHYDLVATLESSVWLYKKRNTYPTEEEQMDEDDDKEEKVGWKGDCAKP